MSLGAAWVQILTRWLTPLLHYECRAVGRFCAPHWSGFSPFQYNYNAGINYEMLGPDEVRSFLTTVSTLNTSAGKCHFGWCSTQHNVPCLFVCVCVFVFFITAVWGHIRAHEEDVYKVVGNIQNYYLFSSFRAFSCLDVVTCSCFVRLTCCRVVVFLPCSSGRSTCLSSRWVCRD